MVYFPYLCVVTITSVLIYSELCTLSQGDVPFKVFQALPLIGVI